MEVWQLADQILEQLEVVDLAQRLCRHSQARLRVAKLVLELVVAEGGVERHEHGTQPGSGQQGNHPFGPVRQIDGHTVAGLNAQLAERRRQRTGFSVRLLISQPTLAEYETLTRRLVPDLPREQLRQVMRTQPFVHVRNHLS